MTADELTEFLQRSIPLTRALALRVTELDAGFVRLRAPLEPNLNHHGTAFGGSLAVLGILAGWAALHHGLHAAAIDASLVVRHSALDYLQPVTGELIAECRLPEAQWSGFVATLRSGRRARIEVASMLRCGDAEAMRAQGTYVALPR